MITCLISEHHQAENGFIVSVQEEREGIIPRPIVLREFKLGDRNDNFSRAIEFARYELADALTANPWADRRATEKMITNE